MCFVVHYHWNNNTMNIKEFAQLMSTFALAYPDAKVTFANNKVEVTKVVFDAQTKSINIR